VSLSQISQYSDSDSDVDVLLWYTTYVRLRRISTSILYHRNSLAMRFRSLIAHQQNIFVGLPHLPAVRPARSANPHFQGARGQKDIYNHGSPFVDVTRRDWFRCIIQMQRLKTFRARPSRFRLPKRAQDQRNVDINPRLTYREREIQQGYNIWGLTESSPHVNIGISYLAAHYVMQNWDVSKTWAFPKF